MDNVNVTTQICMIMGDNFTKALITSLFTFFYDNVSKKFSVIYLRERINMEGSG